MKQIRFFNIITLFLLAGAVTAEAQTPSQPRIVNIINFVRYWSLAILFITAKMPSFRP